MTLEALALGWKNVRIMTEGIFGWVKARMPTESNERKGHRTPEEMELAKTLGLFVLTAVAELVGCYLPYLWLRKNGSMWFLFPGALCLAAFAWLLSLHPTGAGRTYAAYGGVYLSMAMLWMWLMENQKPSLWDIVGASVSLLGTVIIVFAPKG